MLNFWNTIMDTFKHTKNLNTFKHNLKKKYNLLNTLKVRVHYFLLKIYF